MFKHGTSEEISMERKQGCVIGRFSIDNIIRGSTGLTPFFFACGHNRMKSLKIALEPKTVLRTWSKKVGVGFEIAYLAIEIEDFLVLDRAHGAQNFSYMN